MIEAKDVVVLILNFDRTKELKDGDADFRIAGEVDTLTRRLRGINPEVELRVIQSSSLRRNFGLNDLGLQGDDRIRGIIPMGHGSSNRFYLSNEYDADGSQFAEELFDVLSRSKSKFNPHRVSIYFSACLLAGDCFSGDSFVNVFSKKWSKLLESRVGLPNETEVIAHSGGTSRFGNFFWVPVSFGPLARFGITPLLNRSLALSLPTLGALGLTGGVHTMHYLPASLDDGGMLTSMMIGFGIATATVIPPLTAVLAQSQDVRVVRINSKGEESRHRSYLERAFKNSFCDSLLPKLKYKG